jgi:hypothetical protein
LIQSNLADCGIWIHSKLSWLFDVVAGFVHKSSCVNPGILDCANTALRPI